MTIKGIGILFLCLFFVGELSAQTDSIAPSLNDSLLIVYLRTNYSPTSSRDYDAARDSMYTFLDVDATDSLTCVYSGLRAKADGSRTPSNGSLSFNTEHTWPQSFYNNSEPMRGDIHHLFPVWSSVNSSRNNNPYAEIDDNLTTSWWYWENGVKLTSIPSSNIDNYSEYYNVTFEPREDHKGNTARAIFYFWAMYQTNSDVVNDESDNEAFFEGMKETLFEWHKLDPVDANEVARSLEVEHVQGNRNPFIHDTSLARRAYFYTEPSPTLTTELYISEVYEANGGNVKYLELFNPGESAIDLSSGDWALIRYTNAGTSPSSVISLTGSIPANSFFVVGDDNSTNGVQSIFGEGLVNQSSIQINHNGNDSYVLIKNASSSADTVDSFAKDNIGNISNFAQNQVAYRIYSALPNNGDFGQNSISNNGDTVASGNWVVFDISSGNSNAKFIATPGYNKGIESPNKTEALITGNAQWRLLSIPGNNATLEEITDDTFIQGVDDSENANVFTFNSSGVYTTPVSSSAILNNGEGIAVYFFDNNSSGSSELPVVLDVSKDGPGSDVSVPLNTSTITSSSYFSLVGNPFQSNFDASSITSDNPIQANIHLLENGLYSPELRSSSILLPWQGFWIESVLGSPATSITFPVSGKTFSNGTIASFSKAFLGDFSARFNLRSSASFDRGCRINLHPEATTDWDIYDASKIAPVTNAYAILGCVDNEKIKSVESFPPDFEGTAYFGLDIEALNVNESLTLEWKIDPEFFEDYSVSLIDNETGIPLNLEKDSSYTFAHTSLVSNTVSKPILDSSLKILKTKVGVFPRFTFTVSASTTVENEFENELPKQFTVYQNYPNPFNPSTKISFQLPESGFVAVNIFDAKGSLVATLGNKIFAKGTSIIPFDASRLASGLYIYRIETEFGSQSKPMLLLK